MKIQVVQLQSSALAWAVAAARGYEPQIGEFGRVKVHATKLGLQSWEWVWFRPDDDWRQGGPLLDELYAAGLELRLVEVCQKYRASLTRWETSFFGDTPRQAALRVLVAAYFGAEVDLPDELAAVCA